MVCTPAFFYFFVFTNTLMASNHSAPEWQNTMLQPFHQESASKSNQMRFPEESVADIRA